MKIGIDTSKWQSSKLDHAKAKQAGYSFIFLRIGCGKTKDKCFENDYAKAVAAGLKVGVYYYTYSTTKAQGTEDATRVLGWLNNRHLDFPVAYDIEDSKQKGASRKTVNSEMYNAFKAKIEANGHYDAILYTGENFYNNYFDKTTLADDLWIAKYSNKQPSVGRPIAIWQFTSDAVDTSYYKGKLDRNYMLNDISKASSNAVKNPYPVPTRNLKRKKPMMKGDDVRWLQCELGFTGSNLDGKFGDKTKTAVLTYQKKHGLKQDGIVGPATRYSLQND